MIKIKLWQKFLYSVKNEVGMIEEHFRDYHIDIGYKGKGNLGQKWFVVIYLEDYCRIFIGAGIAWHSKF